MRYDIYPCDLDPFGECPKCTQDCKHCVGWTECEVDAQIARDIELDKLINQ